MNRGQIRDLESVLDNGLCEATSVKSGIKNQALIKVGYGNFSSGSYMLGRSSTRWRRSPPVFLTHAKLLLTRVFLDALMEKQKKQKQ